MSDEEVEEVLPVNNDSQTSSDSESSEGSDLSTLDESEVLNDSMAETVSNAGTVNTDAITFKQPDPAEEAFEALKKVPAFQTYVQRLISKEMETERKEETKGKEKRKKVVKPKGSTPAGNQNLNVSRVKSPSDTTLYSPALRLENNMTNLPTILAQVGNSRVGLGDQDKNVASLAGSIISNQINKFIEGIRIQSENVAKASESPKPSTSGADEEQAMREEARRKSDQAIINAERFKAVVNPPSGTLANVWGETNGLTGLPVMRQNVPLSEATHNVVNMQVDPNLDIDDQFFHITCHVEENLHWKIAKGEFMDLEKLLPKTRNNRNSFNEHKMDLVY